MAATRSELGQLDIEAGAGGGRLPQERPADGGGAGGGAALERTETGPEGGDEPADEGGREGGGPGRIHWLWCVFLDAEVERRFQV